MPPNERIEPRRINEANVSDINDNRHRLLKRASQRFAQDARGGQIDIPLGNNDRSTVGPVSVRVTKDADSIRALPEHASAAISCCFVRLEGHAEVFQDPALEARHLHLAYAYLETRLLLGQSFEVPQHDQLAIPGGELR